MHPSIPPSRVSRAGPAQLMTRGSDLPGREELRRRWLAITTVLVPPVAVAALTTALWGRVATPLDLVLFAGLYVVTTLGLTAGFHRHFTHRSFQCVPWLRWCLGVAGSMAAEGPIQFWVSVHRKHHAASDTDQDPHSPHHGGPGIRGALLGWFHAHLGWMLKTHRLALMRHAPDLRRDAVVQRCDRRYLLWVAIGIVLPGIIGGVVGGSLASALRGALWGGFLRIVAVQHVTWSINSICHLFGAAPFQTGDHSRNHFTCALLAFGEGWHNNHHAFPPSARHGLLPRQPDIAWWFIRSCERLGWIWDVRLPTPTDLANKRLPTR